MFRACLVALFLALPITAQAEKRVALIIGNNAYTEVSTLQKAVADAEAVAEKMRAAGYKTFLQTDVGRRETNLAISQFTSALDPGDTAFIFYAGHGVQIDGENYLLPTDIAAPDGVSEGFITSESIAVSELLARVRRTGARTTLAIVDACRDNPFAATTGRSIGGARGLARIAAPEGTFVMFSAGAGQQALDRLSDDDVNRNSVFTRALLPKLAEEGLELRDMIFDLREEVRDLARSRNHQQFPAYYDELLGDFYIRPASARAVSEPVVKAPAPSSGDIRADFELARGIGSRSAYERFIATYEDHPDQFVVSVARDLLAAMVDTSETKPEQTPGPVPDVMDGRAIMRATQIELNRLGCNAGGADGVAGRKTRTAFDRFLTASRTGLSASGLGSERALSVLQASSSRCPVVAAVPAPAVQVSLAGRWAYKSQCPNGITSTGTANYKKTGDGSYSGSFSDSWGIKGSLTTRTAGRQFTSAVSWFGGQASESGTISSSGRSYSSQTSTGCKIRATKQ